MSIVKKAQSLQTLSIAKQFATEFNQTKENTHMTFMNNDEVSYDKDFVKHIPLLSTLSIFNSYISICRDIGVDKHYRNLGEQLVKIDNDRKTPRPPPSSFDVAVLDNILLLLRLLLLLIYNNNHLKITSSFS